MTNNNRRSIKCDHCGALYSEGEYKRLELTGHNRVWNFDYRICEACGREITPLKAHIHGKIGGG